MIGERGSSTAAKCPARISRAGHQSSVSRRQLDWRRKKRWDFKVIVPAGSIGMRPAARVEATGRRLPLAHPARLRLLGEFGGRRGRRMQPAAARCTTRGSTSGSRLMSIRAPLVAAGEPAREPREQPARPPLLLGARGSLLRAELPLRDRREILHPRHARLHRVRPLGGRRDEVLRRGSARRFVGARMLGLELRLARGDQRRIGTERPDPDAGIAGRARLRRPGAAAASARTLRRLAAAAWRAPARAPPARRSGSGRAAALRLLDWRLRGGAARLLRAAATGAERRPTSAGA